MRLIPPFVLLLVCISCVKKSSYEQVVIENNSLRKEIHKLKYDIPILYRDIKRFFNNKEFGEAKEKADSLILKYPNSREANDTRILLELIEDEIFYEKLKEIPVYVGSNTSLHKEYLEKYPLGLHVNDVYEILLSNQKEEERSAYLEAKEKHNILAWKQFLIEYPNSIYKEKVNKSMILMEMFKYASRGDRGAFKLNLTSFTKTDVSQLSLRNDTKNTLRVLFNGPEIKEFIVPRDMRKVIKLKSGDYFAVALSSESETYGQIRLHGNYEATFRIK